MGGELPEVSKMALGRVAERRRSESTWSGMVSSQEGPGRGSIM